MTKRIPVWLVVGVLGFAVAACAEVVVLQNGDRIEGAIVSETPTEVLIKRAYKNSSIRFTDKIERSRIARIEKGPVENESAPATIATAATRPASSQPIALAESDRQDLLNRALALWEKKDYANAGMILSRLINGSPRDELARMSKELEGKIETSLGDMAAEAHLQVAITRSRGQSVALQYVTDYEKPYLVPRLTEAYKQALQQAVSPEPLPTRAVPARTTKTAKSESGRRPGPQPGQEQAYNTNPGAATAAQSQPAARSFVISDLLDKPQSFDGNREEAIAVGKHIRQVTSLLQYRMRYDADFRNNPAVRDDLRKEKDRLTALQRELLAKSGEASAMKEKESRPKSPVSSQPRMGPGQRENELMGPGGPAQRMLRQLRQQQDAEEGGQPPPPPPQ